MSYNTDNTEGRFLPTQKDWIYAAAAVDCEGTIGLSRTKNYNRKRVKYLVYCPYVIIGNTNTILTDWLKQTFGGYLKKRTRVIRKHKDVWIWRLGSRATIVPFLKYVMPHLKLKRRQAEMLTEYFGRWHHNDPKWRLEFFRELAQLNKRGRRKTRRD